MSRTTLHACKADDLAFSVTRRGDTVWVTRWLFSIGLGKGRSLTFVHTPKAPEPTHWTRVTPYGDDWYLLSGRY